MNAITSDIIISAKASIIKPSCAPEIIDIFVASVASLAVSAPA